MATDRAQFSRDPRIRNNSSGNLPSPMLNSFNMPPSMMPVSNLIRPCTPCIPHQSPFVWTPFPPNGFPSHFPCVSTFPPPNLQTNQMFETQLKEDASTSTTDDSEFLVIQKRFFGNCYSKVRDDQRIQIWKISGQIQKFYNLLTELRVMVNELKTCNIETEENLDYLFESINIRKEKMASLKEAMNLNNTVIKILRFKINRRKKKRKSRKQHKSFKISMPSKYEIAEQHMQQLIQEANKIEQDKKFKKEADKILSSVLLKKNEARNQLNLLSSLQKLHVARTNVLRNVKNCSTMTLEITGFQNVTDKLKSLWEAKLKEYQVEESGLRVMLEEQAVNAEDEECKKLNKTFGSWLKFLFGVSDVSKDCTNVDEFIQIRHSWDKYVTDDVEHSSKMPSGWVVPKYNTHEEWRKFVR